MVKRALLAITWSVGLGLLTLAPMPGQAATVSRGLLDLNPVDVRVASFNAQNVSLDRTLGAQRPWRDRRKVVIAQILGQRIDVVGLQEVNPSRFFRSRLPSGANQYLDLRNGLNNHGGNYKLTNRHGFNCVDSTTHYHCVYKFRNASQDDRIIYNADTVALVRQGTLRYSAQYGKHPRHLVWAVLQMRATGDQFLFVTTHLTTGSDSVRRQQWYELIDTVGSLKGTLPVVVVGDFNTQKYNLLAGEMLPAMQNAGFGDVLSQEFRVNPIAFPRAQSIVNGWINSYNYERRDVSTYGYADRRDKTGNHIDWIFATNSLLVKEWRMVLRFDPQTLKVKGVLPSDHNMVRATITLP